MDARAETLGIEPCPNCGSGDVRWRGRRPQDFVLTWLRWAAEFVVGMFDFIIGSRRRRVVDATFYGHGDPSVHEELAREMRESNTGHETPRRFWRCRACRREGHVF